jgi:hypothetical protein
MLNREIIAVCSQIHTKHINTPFGQNVGLLNVKTGCRYNNHCACKLLTHMNVLQLHCDLHAVNTHPTHAITPNSNCAEPPEDGRVTPETCRGIDS